MSITHKAVITFQIELDLDPKYYEEGLTPKEMAQVEADADDWGPLLELGTLEILKVDAVPINPSDQH